MNQIELFTSRLCPFALRARLALAEKAVQAREIEIDTLNKPAWFLELSPQGKVPVLRHGTRLVWELAVVCEYVDDILRGPALLPKDPYERARARMWVRFADSRLYARTEALLHSFDDKLHAAIVSELAEMLGFVERHAFAAPRQDGPYWLGAELSLADLAFYPWFEQVCVLERHFGFHMPVELPRLRTWWATVAARDSVRSIGSPPEFYLEAYGRIFSSV